VAHWPANGEGGTEVVPLFPGAPFEIKECTPEAWMIAFPLS
jgi:hypothetical protein